MEDTVALSVRLPAALKALLEQRAKENDRTLNKELIRILKIELKHQAAA